MSALADQKLLTRTFVDVADTLVADFDIVEFLTLLAARCVKLFDLAAVGLLLADPQGGVSVAASSDDRMQLLELFELQHDEGPCLDSYRNGVAVRCDDLPRRASSVGRRSRRKRRSRGFGSVYTVPMRLRRQIIGSVNLLGEPTRVGSTTPTSSWRRRSPTSRRSASCSIEPPKSTSCSPSSSSTTLTSRVLVEQAKGVVAEARALRHGRRVRVAAHATPATTTSGSSRSRGRWSSVVWPPTSCSADAQPGGTSGVVETPASGHRPSRRSGGACPGAVTV